MASGLAAKSEEYVVNSLMYIMGDKSGDMLNTLTLSDDQRKKYKEVCQVLGEHLIGQHNVIYERAKFNSRYQQPGESAENVITDVYELAEHCQNEVLLEEMIRDRIVSPMRRTVVCEYGLYK